MPQKTHVSVDEFIGTRSLVSKDGIVYRAAKMPKTFDAKTRSATFIMTDETVDSYGDIVRAKGCNLDRFENNPICLLNHSASLILGSWSDVKRIVKRIEGTATIAEAGTAPHVDMAYNLMAQGILRAASIGFMPLKVERRLDDNGEPMWSYDILEWEMYECSVVSVPANPAALAKSMKEGSMMARDLLEEVLDNYVKMPSGVIVAIKDIEAAHKAGGGDKTAVMVDIPADVAETLDAPETREANAPPADVEPEVKDIEALQGLLALAVAEGSIAVEHDIVEAEPVNNYRAFQKVDGGAIVSVDTDNGFLTLSFPVWSDDHAAAVLKRSEELKVKAPAPVEKLDTLVVDVDVTALEGATEKVTALSALLDSVQTKLARFFGSKAAEPEPVEPPAPPTVEEIDEAKAKAAESLARLATKGLIEA